MEVKQNQLLEVQKKKNKKEGIRVDGFIDFAVKRKRKENRRIILKNKIDSLFFWLNGVYYFRRDRFRLENE